MQEIRYRPIGVIRTPFASPEGMPIQPAAAKGVVGRVELDPGLADGLKDLDGFSHVILIYHFHRAKPAMLRVKPYMDSVERGVFATRSPARPNAIGISVVRLLGVERNVLRVENVDIVDGTPLLDIKPYVPQFDGAEDVRIGWLQDNVGRLDQTRDDGRFGVKTTSVKSE
ncbi:MAG TPA: tRNA (N6-threonylcarbamoyladenosine(37)-N6)-methyltransferase TrmO [Syntrophales bacterium]|nr:tRNA (N6-threonylcarbamoyladenosine(37)-N6)-methyltransferase TrmO [Syntrophales bacterium]